MKKQKSFEKQFTELFRYIVNRRIALMKNGFSQKPQVRMNSLLDKFIPYLAHDWSYTGAARFLLRHFFEIRQLIPEHENNVINRLENLYLISKTALIKNQKPCQAF